MARSYPLEAAVLDRQGRRARSEGELAGVLAALTRVEREVVAAQAAIDAHRAARPGVEQVGPAVGRELRRAAAFARRHAADAERLRATHQAVLEKLGAARAAVAKARAALGEAHAAEHVIERAREQFQLEGRKRVREAEQDELDDQLVVRSRRPR